MPMKVLSVLVPIGVQTGLARFEQASTTMTRLLLPVML